MVVVRYPMMVAGSDMQSARPLVAIVGPTGSGKSDLSLRLCQEFGGEVVNSDSLQFYRHFDIGTAKLPEAGRRGIPHHMMDILNPDEIFTAGEFAARARPLLASIAERRLPVVVGGTGFYLRALLDGLAAAPSRDDALRARLAARERFTELTHTVQCRAGCGNGLAPLLPLPSTGRGLGWEGLR